MIAVGASLRLVAARRLRSRSGVRYYVRTRPAGQRTLAATAQERSRGRPRGRASLAKIVAASGGRDVFDRLALRRALVPSAICSHSGQRCAGIAELGEKGLLLKYIVASLFRVTWGFTLALILGIPFGLILGWYARAFQAFNPLIQIFRPISPIAWIPVAILWFGVSDAAPIFLIFLASVFPITVSTIAAVQNMQPVYLRAAQNFGLGRGELFRRVILRAACRRSSPAPDRARRRLASRGRRRDDRG